MGSRMLPPRFPTLSNYSTFVRSCVGTGEVIGSIVGLEIVPSEVYHCTYGLLFGQSSGC
jgi:hypothetical protein